MTTVQVTEVPVTTVPITMTSTPTSPSTTSAPVAPSTTAPKRQVSTTVPTAPKTKTPVITGTPSEILDKLRADVTAREQNVYDSGNFGLFGEIVGPLQKKYAGAATLVRNQATSGSSYTAKSGDLTQVWYVESDDYGAVLLVER